MDYRSWRKLVEHQLFVVYGWDHPERIPTTILRSYYDRGFTPQEAAEMADVNVEQS